MEKGKLLARCRSLQRGLAQGLRDAGYLVTIHAGRPSHLPRIDVGSTENLFKNAIPIRVRPVGHVLYVFEREDTDARNGLVLYGRSDDNLALCLAHLRRHQR